MITERIKRISRRIPECSHARLASNRTWAT
jgi:hypothetical protein